MKTIIHFSVLLIIAFPSTSIANEISKKQWIDSMSTSLPTVFCQPKQYFRQCFQVTQKECEEVAMSSTRVCLDKNKNNIPKILIQPKDGTYWGTVVGSCAGEAYETALMRKIVNSKKCNNPNNLQ